MQVIFSILSVLGIIALVLWWNTQGIRPASPVGSSEEATEDQILNPIEKANEVKEALESKSTNALDLSGKGLTKAPANIFDQTDLESLDLSNNELTGALQGEVRFLQDLRVLNLSGNKFSGVPAEIGQLKNLEILNLSNNLLTGLPNELGNLSNLKLLDVSGNDYSSSDLATIRKNLPASTVIKTE